jgi:hypothetical protein
VHRLPAFGVAFACLLPGANASAEENAADEPAINRFESVVLGSAFAMSGYTTLASGSVLGVSVLTTVDDFGWQIFGGGLGFFMALGGYGVATTGVPFLMIGAAPAVPAGQARRSHALYVAGTAFTTTGLAAVVPGVFLWSLGSYRRDHPPAGSRQDPNDLIVGGAATAAGGLAFVAAGLGMYLWGREPELPGEGSARASVGFTARGLQISF